MAKERKASVIYEGNGTQQTFSFPFDYLRKVFVKAEIIESSGIIELEQGKDYSITDKELTLARGVSVATGKLLKIYRETTTDPLVEWQDASVLRSADLSLQEVQLLHLAEETADKVFDSGMSTASTNTNVWDGQYKRLTNLLDPQEEGDAVTLRYVNDKQQGLLNALKNEGANQNASIVATGNTQNSRLNTTGDTQNKRLTDTGDSYVATMTTLKDTATTKATEAKNSATSASTSASTATTKATEAKNSATSASTSASTATTKATEAKNSATLAKAWAMSDSSPDGVSGNKSSKTWANEAKNSASTATAKATEATTKATEAKNSASAAAKSAENAKIWDPSSYYKKTETYNRAEVDNKIATDGMPTGTVLAFAGNTVPNNYLLCDGSAVSRSTYANLFKVIGTTYGAGNGSTTFNLPNLVDRFVEGGSASGAMKNAGLPNITGRLSTQGLAADSQFLADELSEVSGVFSVEGKGEKYGIDNSKLVQWGYTALNFDASKSNSIYGSSSTVQPPAIVMKYIIKI